MSRTARKVRASLPDRIRAAAESGELTLPPLPEVATRLMTLLRDEDAADPRRVAALMVNEPAMTASVLRVANSASFGGMRTVSELEGAIARLGMRQVSALVTAVSHRGHFASDDPERLRLLRALWDHAVATALVSRHLARLGEGDTAEAFLAGLLHDCGKLLVLKGLDQLESEDAFSPAVAEELMALMHATLGCDVLRGWRIAEPICNVALHHHDDPAASDEPLLMCVQAANEIAHRLVSPRLADAEPNLLESPAIERLNLGDLELATLMVDIEDEIAEVRQLF